MKDLTKGNPLKLILSFSLPVCIGNILQLCYNLADTRIVGTYLGEEALAAVGSTVSLNSLILGFLIGLANGFSVITARYFGANDIKNLKRSVANSLILGLSVAAILTVLSTVFLTPILQMLNTPEHILADAKAYIRIILLGMTLSLLYNICAATLRAIGDSLTPLFFLFLSAILNVIFDLVFIRVLNMGVEGAAYATVISQLISVVLSIVYIIKHYPILHISRSDFTPDTGFIRHMISSGLSMGLMMSLVNFGTLALQSSINTFGSDTIVAHTAARKITEVYMLPFGVFGTTMTTYCGQNFGAGRYDRIRHGLIGVMLITWAWCFLVIIASFTIAPMLINLVTGSDNVEIISTATKYLKINSIFYFVPAVITIVRCSMQGFGYHITPIVSSFIELAGKVLIVIFLTPRINYMGIIVSEPIVWILMVIPLLIMLLKSPVFKKQP